MLTKNLIIIGATSILGSLFGYEYVQTKREYTQHPNYGSLFHTFQHRIGRYPTILTLHVMDDPPFEHNSKKNNMFTLKCKKESDYSSTVYRTTCARMCAVCKKLHELTLVCKTSEVLPRDEYMDLPWFSETLVERMCIHCKKLHDLTVVCKDSKGLPYYDYDRPSWFSETIVEK